MKLVTKHFGELEIEESKIIEFSSGIPGFNDLRRFVLLSDEETDRQSPFYWLQSVDEPKIAFIMVDVIKIYPEYNPLVGRDFVEEELGEYDPEHFYIYNIANIPENVNEMTVNLKAPIVINERKKRGMQVICDNDEYSVRHYLFK